MSVFRLFGAGLYQCIYIYIFFPRKRVKKKLNWRGGPQESLVFVDGVPGQSHNDLDVGQLPAHILVRVGIKKKGAHTDNGLFKVCDRGKQRLEQNVDGEGSTVRRW